MRRFTARHQNEENTPLRLPRLLFLVAKVAILDGVAQLWEHSPQWFCLVCKHLLEIGVLSPTSVVYYVFREDNSNAIALSPFLWEVGRIQ